MRASPDGFHRGRLLTWTATLAVFGLALPLSDFRAPRSNHPPPSTNTASLARPHFPLAISPDAITLGVIPPVRAPKRRSRSGISRASG